MRALAIITRSTSSGGGLIGIGGGLTRVPFTTKVSDLNNLFTINNDGDLVANQKMQCFADAAFTINNTDSGSSNVVKSYLYVNGNEQPNQGLQAKVLQNTGGNTRAVALLDLEAGDVVGFYGSAQVEADIGVLASEPDVQELNAIIILSVLG